MDNWFTSVNLSDRLEALNTSIVGTIRNNRTGIPPNIPVDNTLQTKSQKL
ncbi:hypothetical protein [Salmonella sp. zj-h17]